MTAKRTGGNGGVVLDGGDSSMNNSGDTNQPLPNGSEVMIHTVLGDYGSRIESNAQSIDIVSDMVLGLSTQLTNFMKRGRTKIDDIDGQSDEDDKLEDSGCRSD
ncbi:hypothetical protein Tco_0690934, partial [Tanacetum coccineum]